MTTDYLKGTLADLGAQFDLGEYEIEAYVTVLQHGQLTAAEIAELTDIPQPRVYDTVRGLAEYGFVEIRESRPMQVLAVDPTDVFDDVQTRLDDLVADLERHYTAPSRDSEAASLIKSRQTILRYLQDVVSAAEYELVVSLTPELLGRFEEELRDKRAAGVNVDLLVAPATEAPTAEEYDYTTVATTARARRGVTTPVVAVADGEYSVYTTREAVEDGDRYGVIFNRSELGFLVSGFLDTVVWRSASTLTERPDEPSFPRRYASIRRCVQELDGVSGPLYVTVDGRDVETGARRTVEGKVTDVDSSPDRATASLTVETADGEVVVGGQVAAIEDVEATELVVDRDAPSGA